MEEAIAYEHTYVTARFSVIEGTYRRKYGKVLHFMLNYL
jgi:hypothetical protein